MPYSGGSAMNPNGTWQTDGIDQIQMANRQHNLQMQQMGMQRSHEDMMRDLALKQLQSGDNRFSAELADRQGARAQGRQDQMNMFSAQADLAKAGWAHDDTRHSGDLEAQLAIAKLGKEPNSLEAQKYADEHDWQTKIMGMLDGGGAAPGGPDAGGFSNDTTATIRPQGPSMGGGAGGGMQFDPKKLQIIAALQALRHGGSIPNIGAQDAQNELTNLEVSDRKRASATARAKAALDSGDVTGAKAIAAQEGVALPIAPIEETVAGMPGISSGLGDMADSFAKRDTAMVGFDPSDGDLKQIMDERDRMATILVNKGYPPDAAQREANRVITMHVGSHANDMNAGSIQALLRKLNGGTQSIADQNAGGGLPANVSMGGGF